MAASNYSKNNTSERDASGRGSAFRGASYGEGKSSGSSSTSGGRSSAGKASTASGRGSSGRASTASGRGSSGKASASGGRGSSGKASAAGKNASHNGNATNKNSFRKDYSKSMASARQTDMNFDEGRRSSNVRDIVGVCMIVFAILLGIFIYGGTDGWIRWLAPLLRGLFGIAAYALPIILTGCGVYLIVSDRKKLSASYIVSAAVMFAAVLMIIHLSALKANLGLKYFKFIAFSYECGVAGSGGGAISALIARILTALCGFTGSIVLLIGVIMITLLIFTRASLKDFGAKLFRRNGEPRPSSNKRRSSRHASMDVDDLDAGFIEHSGKPLTAGDYQPPEYLNALEGMEEEGFIEPTKESDSTPIEPKRSPSKLVRSSTEPPKRTSVASRRSRIQKKYSTDETADAMADSHCTPDDLTIRPAVSPRRYAILHSDRGSTAADDLTLFPREGDLNKRRRHRSEDNLQIGESFSAGRTPIHRYGAARLKDMGEADFLNDEFYNGSQNYAEASDEASDKPLDKPLDGESEFGTIASDDGYSKELFADMETGEVFDSIPNQGAETADNTIDTKADNVAASVNADKSESEASGTAYSSDTETTESAYSSKMEESGNAYSSETEATEENIHAETEVSSDAGNKNIHAKAPKAEKIDTLKSEGTNAKTSVSPAKKDRGASPNTIAGEVPPELREYRRPPLTLLKKPEQAERIANSNSSIKAKALMEALASFGVNAKLVSICEGPRVVRFEIQLAQGIRVNKVTTLKDDLGVALAASPVRIEAPIPGKTTIGIEIPNGRPEKVLLREVLESDSFKNAKTPLLFALGKDITGNVITADLSEMPHMLVAGRTGTGKSVCINSIILSIAYRSSPKEVRMILIDPKVVEFKIYAPLPHLFCPVVTDMNRAAGALRWATKEMDKRYQEMGARHVRGIDRYNELQTNEDDRWPRLVIIIDELSDLMLVAPKDVEESILRISQLGRACGIHLIVATQRPSVDVITGTIKANLPTKIAFAVGSYTDSKVILDTGGAETLLGKGDMIFAPDGSAKPIRVQGSLVTDTEVENVMNFFAGSDQPIAVQDEDMIKELNAIPGVGEAHNDIQDEEELPDAVRTVIESGKASTSLLQRRLRVGYAKASRLMDIMEQKGYVGPADGAKPRTVLITPSVYREIFGDERPIGGDKV